MDIVFGGWVCYFGLFDVGLGLVSCSRLVVADVVCSFRFRGGLVGCGVAVWVCFACVGILTVHLLSVLRCVVFGVGLHATVLMCLCWVSGLGWFGAGGVDFGCFAIVVLGC